MGKRKYRKQLVRNNKFQVLKTWMTSLAMTVGVVIVAATLIPVSPKATIHQIQSFQNEIIYQVDVTDEDGAILEDSLKVILENQFETHTYSLQLGFNVGVFSNLKEDTKYTMHVVGNKGFGEEKLATRRVSTMQKSGGAIVSYAPTTEDIDYHIDYLIGIIIRDPMGDYKDVTLYYGYIIESEMDEFEYETIPIVDASSQVLIEFIPNYHTYVHLYLEATLQSDEKVILDELYFHTPFTLHSSFYIEQVTNNSLTVSLYPDFVSQTDTVYEISVKQNQNVIATKLITEESDYDAHMGSLYVFENLLKSTDYTVELTASYTDPYTLKRETVLIESYQEKTLGDYSVDISLIEYDTYYDLTITVIDPNHHFQIPYYTLYEIFAEHDEYFSGEMGDFTPLIQGKTAYFFIYKPHVSSYRLEIGIRNQTFYQYYVIIENIVIEN
ncbi:MAG: hypothetical protein IH571_02305 [Acholeplasmataceae bacterium]|nr:hypothetical protein [Acholeplasmataceae bacterium]